MDIMDNKWSSLELEFRTLIKEYFATEIEIYESIGNKDIPLEEQAQALTQKNNLKLGYQSCANIGEFIKYWKENISSPDWSFTYNDEVFHTENYIHLAQELGAISHKFLDMKELISYATRWTRETIKNKQILLSSRDIEDYDKKQDTLLSKNQELVVDHAFYAMYVAWKPDSKILIKDNNKELLKALSKDESIIQIISARRFEEIIAYLFESLGCKKVLLTQLTRDFGADILAWHGGPLNSEILSAIKVKKYSPGNNVGLKDVYELHGAVAHYSANLGQIITTSDFTKEGLAFAKGENYNAVNLAQLQHEIANLFKH